MVHNRRAQFFTPAELSQYRLHNLRPASRDVLVCSRPDPVLGDYLEAQYVAPDAELVSLTLPLRTPVATFFADAPDSML